MVEIARRVAWLPVVVLLIHEGNAHVFDAYGRWPSIDIPMHLLGGFAMAYFFSGSLTILCKHQLINPQDRFVRIILVFALTCVAVVFWEFAEWVADHTLGTFSQLGLDDTIGDMLCGILGGTVFLLLSLFRKGPGPGSHDAPRPDLRG